MVSLRPALFSGESGIDLFRNLFLVPTFRFQYCSRFGFGGINSQRSRWPASIGGGGVFPADRESPEFRLISGGVLGDCDFHGSLWYGVAEPGVVAPLPRVVGLWRAGRLRLSRGSPFLVAMGTFYTSAAPLQQKRGNIFRDVTASVTIPAEIARIFLQKSGWRSKSDGLNRLRDQEVVGSNPAAPTTNSQWVARIHQGAV